jgi:P-type E1-E2 ATPase
MPQLSWAIAAVVLINGVFSYWQEYRAERAVEELAAMLPRQVTVKRDGQEQTIPASEVVQGYLLVLTEGEAIPADARVVAAQRLNVDTSALTGESHPAPRRTWYGSGWPNSGHAAELGACRNHSGQRARGSGGIRDRNRD